MARLPEFYGGQGSISGKKFSWCKPGRGLLRGTHSNEAAQTPLQQASESLRISRAGLLLGLAYPRSTARRQRSFAQKQCSGFRLSDPTRVASLTPPKRLKQQI